MAVSIRPLNMIDYVKMSTHIRDVEGYKKESQMLFTQNVETRTGEITSPFSRAKLDNMDIFLSDKGYFEIKGSIHKYFNGGSHNHNDFSTRNFYSAIQRLSKLLQIDLWQCKLDALEVGVNITPAICTTEFLNCTYMHRRKPFKNVSMGEGGDYRQAEYKDYWVKIYDKGAQYNLAKQLLRFELKYRADELRRMNLNHMCDLRKIEVIDMLGELLSHKFDQIVFLEPTLIEDHLPLRYREKLLLWKNPRYWNDLAINPPSKNSYSREVALLNDIQSILTDSVKADTMQRIKYKWGELVDDANLSGLDMGKISTSYIVPKIPAKKSCLVTGLDISMQKESSRFLYNTGVMYYHEHHPEIYGQLEERLNSTWYQEPIEVLCREIAHSIRNEYHNRRRELIAQQSAYRSYPTLFKNSDQENDALLDKYGILS